MRFRSYLLLAALSMMFACDNRQKTAELTQAKRVECLDRFCEGDTQPKTTPGKDVAIKLNGHWYVGPSVYGNPNFGAIAFYWPSKVATGDAEGIVNAKEVVRSKSGSIENFYDVAIEVFLKSISEAPAERSTYQVLLRLEQQGNVVEKRSLRDGLDMWKTRDGNIEEIWYVATKLSDPTGDRPVVACRGGDTTQSRCTGAFTWQPGVAASMRFRAAHGPDWPEIYLELSRVLALIKKA